MKIHAMGVELLHVGGETTEKRDEGNIGFRGVCERVKKFYVLPTQCIYVFCVDLRTNSHYFPIQH